MGEQISASDRALIDAAIAAGAVKRIPAGQSSLSEQFVWDARLKMLVRRDGMNWKGQKSRDRARRARGLTPEIERRRGQMLALAQDGLTMAQIAERLGVSEFTVRADATACRFSFADACLEREAAERAAREERDRAFAAERRAQREAEKAQKERERAEAAAARAAERKRLAEARKPEREAAAKRRAAERAAQKEERQAQPRPPRRQRPIVERVAARRAQVKEALDQGMSGAEVMAMLRIPRAMFKGDIRALGIRLGARQLPTQLQATMDARAKALAEMVARGDSAKQCAAALGVHRTRVYALCHKFGLPNPQPERSGPKVAR